MFTPGKSGNPNGRPRGVPNKATSETRQRIQNLWDENFERIKTDLQALEPRDRLRFLSDLLPYIVPRLQTTTIEEGLNLDGLSDEDLNKLLEKILST